LFVLLASMFLETGSLDTTFDLLDRSMKPLLINKL
jgi:hypothetical protein